MDTSSANASESRRDSSAASESQDKQEVFSSGPLKRVVLADADSVNSATLLKLWKEQDRYLDQLEAKFQEESAGLRDLEVKSRSDGARREQLLAMRLQVKEQEIQELSNQVSELKAAQVPSTTQLRSTLVDPGVNVIIRQLQKELEDARKKQQETQEELNAWKFTPDSATGKRLMSKCRQLIQENEEIGKMISGGRLAKLEGELAMQRTLCEEMKKNQLEMDEFVQELDEDVEGMQVRSPLDSLSAGEAGSHLTLQNFIFPQSTVYLLQQQLKEAKERIKELEGTEDQNRSILRIADDNQSMAEEETKESKSEETQPLKKEPCAEANETDDPNESDPTEQVMADHKPEVEDEKVAEEKEDKFVPKREQDDEDDECGEEEEAAEEKATPSRGKKAAATTSPKAAPTTPTRRTRGQKREPTSPSPKGRASSSSPAGGRPKRRRAPPQRFTNADGNEEGEEEEAVESK